jgi:hypothetical protein
VFCASFSLSFSENSDKEEETYVVEAALDAKMVKGELKFLTKWTDWPVSDSTWYTFSLFVLILYLV